MLDALLPGLTNSPNVHPVFVHFPVALWIVAAGAWLLWLFRRDESLWRFGQAVKRQPRSRPRTRPREQYESTCGPPIPHRVISAQSTARSPTHTTIPQNPCRYGPYGQCADTSRQGRCC